MGARRPHKRLSTLSLADLRPVYARVFAAPLKKAAGKKIFGPPRGIWPMSGRRGGPGSCMKPRRRRTMARTDYPCLPCRIRTYPSGIHGDAIKMASQEGINPVKPGGAQPIATPPTGEICGLAAELVAESLDVLDQLRVLRIAFNLVAQVVDILLHIGTRGPAAIPEAVNDFLAGEHPPRLACQ